MHRRRMVRLALLGLVLAAGVLAAGLVTLGTAGSVLANTVPRVEGDGNDEDTPFLPRGVPILHVHVSPHWFGWVRSTRPAGYYIDCPMACRRPVPAGTQITLVAHPEPGWSVGGWLFVDAPPSVQCQGPVSNICSFTMPGPSTGLPATDELELVVNLTTARGGDESGPPPTRTRTRPPR